MPVDMVSMEGESPSGLLRLALVGEEKSGKSRCASTGRKPVLFLDFDQRRAAVAGIPGVYAITFRDNLFPKMPDAAALALDLMGCLEKSLDLSKLELVAPDGTKAVITPTPPEGTILKTIVFDSMHSMANAFRNYAMANNADLRREIAIGKTKSYMPRGWDTWNAETSQIEPFILRSFGLGVDVITIFHTTKEKAEDSTEDEPKFTGRIGVYPARYKSLLKFFSEIWQMKLEQAQTTTNGKISYRFVPRVKPWPDYSFNAATAMLLDETEEPNIAALIAKHELRLGQGLNQTQSSITDGSSKKLKGFTT